MGTENNVSGSELYVVDVTNPASPSLVESYEVGASINKVSVKANFVYMATGNTNKELVALNTDSGSQSSFDIASAMGAKSLYYSGGKVFAGSADSVFLTDVSSTPFNQLSNATLGGSLNDIAVLGTTGFLGTADPLRYFQFWDFSSPDSPKLCASTSQVYSLTAPVTGVVVQENYVYLSLKDEFGPLRIIKIK